MASVAVLFYYKFHHRRILRNFSLLQVSSVFKDIIIKNIKNRKLSPVHALLWEHAGLSPKVGPLNFNRPNPSGTNWHHQCTVWPTSTKMVTLSFCVFKCFFHILFLKFFLGSFSYHIWEKSKPCQYRSLVGCHMCQLSWNLGSVNKRKKGGVLCFCWKEEWIDSKKRKCSLKTQRGMLPNSEPKMDQVVGLYAEEHVALRRSGF